MRGPSRAAYDEAVDHLAVAVADPAAAAVAGEELFAVTGLLDAEPAVRRALTDASRPGQARAGLARALLAGRVAPATLAVVTEMVTARWSVPGDLADATEQLAVLATAAAADAAGELDDAEDELFRFARITSGEPELRSALSNPQLPAGRKRGLLEALLAGRVTAAALRLITQATLHPRGRSLDGSLDEYARLAAGWRQRLIAVVRVATELSPGARRRLAAALSASYGRSVHLNVVLDPSVLGGMSVQIGDEFIDGSLSSRLAELRRRLAA